MQIFLIEIKGMVNYGLRIHQVGHCDLIKRPGKNMSHRASIKSQNMDTFMSYHLYGADLAVNMRADQAKTPSLNKRLA